MFEKKTQLTLIMMFLLNFSFIGLFSMGNNNFNNELNFSNTSTLNFNSNENELDIPNFKFKKNNIKATKQLLKEKIEQKKAPELEKYLKYLNKDLGIKLSDYKFKNNNGPLHLAVLTGSNKIVAILVDFISETEGNIDPQNIDGDTPLHLAVKLNNYKIVSTILHKHADIIKENKNKKTPLSLALEKEDRLILKIFRKLFLYEKFTFYKHYDSFVDSIKESWDEDLIFELCSNFIKEKKACDSNIYYTNLFIDIYKQTKKTDSNLLINLLEKLKLKFQFPYNRVIDLVDHLSKQGNINLEIDINERVWSSKLTLLNLICNRLNEGVKVEHIKCLLDKGADIYETSNVVRRPLHSLCDNNCENKLELIKCLIENASKLDSKKKIKRYINCKDQFGESPLSLICKNQDVNPQIEVIKYLVENGADVNNANNEKENTPLISICCGKFDPSLEVIKYLVENGANVNSQNNKGKSPLLLICERKKPKLSIIKYLVAKGANVKAVDNQMETVLHKMSKIGKKSEDGQKISTIYYKKIFTFLIKNGADVKAKNSCYNSIAQDIMPKYHSKNINLEQIQKSFQSIQQDFLKFFNGINGIETNNINDYNCNLFYDKIINGVRVNKIWVKTTTNKKIIEVENIINDYCTNNQLNRNEASLIFFRWLYTRITPQDEVSKKIIMELCKKLDISFEKKSGKKGLIRNLKKLQKKGNKDFSIFVSVGKRILRKVNVHKFILFVRSGLFRGLFISTGDCNQVKDYTKSKLEKIQSLVNFLYNDDISLFEDNEDLIEFFKDAIEYYQLNKNSTLIRI